MIMTICIVLMLTICINVAFLGLCVLLNNKSPSVEFCGQEVAGKTNKTVPFSSLYPFSINHKTGTLKINPSFIDLHLTQIRISTKTL